MATTYLLLSASTSAEIQTQHVFDTSVKRNRFEVLVHFRARTKPEAGSLFQIRTGPIFEFGVNDRLTLIAGYYFTREHNESRWATINRPFGDGEAMLWSRAVEVDWAGCFNVSRLRTSRITHASATWLRISRLGQTAPYVGSNSS